ncbi:MAG: alpha/beta hydrolase [Thermaerobacterales bacterium]
MGNWERRYTLVDGIETHYIEAGQGHEQTLLLIHGGGLHSCAELNYGAVMEPLSRRVHVIAPDVAGFGRTPGRDPDHLQAPGQGDFLVKFMRALDLKAHVGGNSHGGWLCQYLAHEVPERVKSLIIINSLNGTAPVHNYKGHWRAEGEDAHPGKDAIRESLRQFYIKKDLVTEERVNRTMEIGQIAFDFARKRLEADRGVSDKLHYRGKHIAEWAPELEMPILMTWSKENRGSAPEEALPYLYSLGKDQAEMHIFLNAGHHVQTEHPERWSEIVTNFVLSESRFG